MTTRRDFCKNLLAAGIASASLPAFAKAYCGMDFGKDAAKTVWNRLGTYSPWPGGRYEGVWINESVSVPWELLDRQLIGFCMIPKVDFEGTRASAKSLCLSAPKPREKSKREKQEEEYRWIWFEEASEFDNWQYKEREL